MMMMSDDVCHRKLCISTLTLFCKFLQEFLTDSRFVNISSEKNYVWKNLRDRIFFNFFFNLSSDVILVKEHGCMYVWMNGSNSDNAISIQTMATQKMVTQKMVGRNMVSRNMVTPNMVGRNMVTPNMVGRNLVTPNMVTPKLLGTRLHRTQPFCGVQHW